MPETTVTVGDIMRTSLHTIDGLASVEEAVGTMKRLGVSSLVIERRHPGDEHAILSVRDIAKYVVAENRSLARTSVYQVMSKPALAVVAGMNVRYAIRLLSRFGINRALVTRDDELIGLVTLRDLVVGFARAGAEGEKGAQGVHEE